MRRRCLLQWRYCYRCNFFVLFLPFLSFLNIEQDHNLLLQVLCKSYPSEFISYFHYCRSLRFEDKPDYSYLKRLFRDLFIREGECITLRVNSFLFPSFSVRWNECRFYAMVASVPLFWQILLQAINLTMFLTGLYWSILRLGPAQDHGYVLLDPLWVILGFFLVE